MRFFPLVLTLASLFSIQAAQAGLEGVCGRSHADAIELLGRDRKTALVEGEWNEVYSSAFISPSERDRLVRSGDYVVGLNAPKAPSQYQSVIPAMQMGIDNVYGRFGMGVCWWHSRFHRAALYLMDFAPNLPKPTANEAIVLFRRISNLQTATIPGYRSLYEVTRDFPKELGWVLSDWQLRTTFVAPKYALGGALTKVFTPKSEWKKRLAESAWNVIHDLAAMPRPIFLFLENRTGIHAVLAIAYEVNPTDPSEIWLKFIDSNDPIRVRKEVFIKDGEFAGASTIAYYGVHQGFDDDFARIRNALRTRCGANYQIPLN